MKKFQDKYRIESARLKNWDYGRNAAYFITICTHNRQHFFGEIIDDNMILNKTGSIADSLWRDIPKQFPYIILDEFVVMPNHVHGILIVDKPISNESNESNDHNNGRDAINRVSTVVSKNPGGFAGDKNPMLNENISRINRWYKGRCTFEIRKFNQNFMWQTRFYDHIIRNNKSFNNIQNYILNNPANWSNDKFKQK